MVKYFSVWILNASAMIFDNFLILTLSPELYDMPWVKVAWVVMRDLVNVAFILGIIIIGFFMILGRETGSDG